MTSAAKTIRTQVLGRHVPVNATRLPATWFAGPRVRRRYLMALVVAIGLLTVVNVQSDLRSDSFGSLTEIAEGLLILLLLLGVHETAAAEATRERGVAVLLANASDALTVVDGDGKITMSNPAAAEMFGVAPGSSIGRPVFSFFDKVHPDERAGMRARLSRVLATPGTMATALIRAQGPDGTYRFLEVSAANRIAEPSVRGIVLNFHDVTERIQATSELTRLGTAVAQASDAVVVTNVAAEIEYVNSAFERISGYRRDEVVGRNPRFLQSGKQSGAFYEAMWKTLLSGQPWRADFINRRKDGALYRMVGMITPLRNEAGEVTGYVGVQRDVTRQRALEDSARQLSRQRTLVAETIRDINPRQSPEDIAQNVCAQVAALGDVALACMFIYEADGRATPYGFAVSSGAVAPRRRVPKARSRYLFERCESGPWIEAWADHASHPYNQLFSDAGVRAFAYAPVRDNGRTIGFFAVGSSVANAQEELAALLPVVVECGDICGTLLGVRVAEQSQQKEGRRRIAQVIEGRAFFPVYQPLVDIASNKIVGYEALTRFDDGSAPHVRFDEAHECGLGTKLELAAIAAALEGADQLPPAAWLNVNASPELVMNGAELGRLLADSTRDIVLEVTEHSQIADYAAFRRALQDLGPRVRLAVDDAGAGFASLRHILELRPAFVKLDREVIGGIDHDEARQAMVAGLEHFALSTGCWLIAEGVETAQEMHALQELNVRYVQGFLVGRPTAAREVRPHATLGLDGSVDGIESAASTETRRGRR